MYVICTDGTEIVRSKIADRAELAQLNREAEEAAADNWYWLPGNPENATWPKADEYKHIHSGRN